MTEGEVKTLAKGFAPAIRAAIERATKPLNDKIEALETASKARGSNHLDARRAALADLERCLNTVDRTKFCGSYMTGENYFAGDVVMAAGAFWFCTNTDAPSVRHPDPTAPKWRRVVVLAAVADDK